MGGRIRTSRSVDIRPRTGLTGSFNPISDHITVSSRPRDSYLRTGRNPAERCHAPSQGGALSGRLWSPSQRFRWADDALSAFHGKRHEIDRDYFSADGDVIEDHLADLGRKNAPDGLREALFDIPRIAMGTFMRILQRLSTQPYNPYVAERQDILTHSLRDEAFNKILFGLTEDDRIDLHEVRYYIELVRAIALKTVRSISLAAMDTPAGKDTSWPSITDSIAVNEWARLAQDMGSYLRLIGTLLDEITPESHKW